MTQFVAFDPKAEVSGSAILLLIAAIGHPVVPIITRHFGVTTFTPDLWLPMQANLDVLREISQPAYNVVSDFVKIGIRVPDFFEFPPEINSISMALQSLNEAYHWAHRNGEIGYYRAEIKDENHIDVICHNPYPCDFDYGLIYGMVRRFCPEGFTFTVRHAEGECRKNGGDTCIYHVEWKEIEEDTLLP